MVPPSSFWTLRIPRSLKTKPKFWRLEGVQAIYVTERPSFSPCSPVQVRSRQGAQGVSGCLLVGSWVWPLGRWRNLQIFPLQRRFFLVLIKLLVGWHFEIVGSFCALGPSDFSTYYDPYWNRFLCCRVKIGDFLVLSLIRNNSTLTRNNSPVKKSFIFLSF